MNSHYWVVDTFDSERFARRVATDIGLLGRDSRQDRAKASGNWFGTRRQAQAWIARNGVLAGSRK